MSTSAFGALTFKHMKDWMTNIVGMDVSDAHIVTNKEGVYKVQFGNRGCFEVLDGIQGKAGTHLNWMDNMLGGRVNLFFGLYQPSHLTMRQPGVMISGASKTMEYQATLSAKFPEGTSHVVRVGEDMLTDPKNVLDHRRFLRDGYPNSVGHTQSSYWAGKAHQLLNIGDTLSPNVTELSQYTPRVAPFIDRSHSPINLSGELYTIYNQAGAALNTKPPTYKTAVLGLKRAIEESAPGLEVTTNKPGQPLFTQVTLIRARDIIARVMQRPGAATSIVGMIAGGLLFAGVNSSG